MENVAIGFLSIPVIVALVQFFKRVIPLTGNVWLITSFVLGVLAQVLSSIAIGTPTDMLGWLALVGIGVVGGLASSKAYDEAKARGLVE